MSTEALEFDVVIVGAGPAGLSAAIKLVQLNNNLKISILEKGSEVGSHILSGAILEPGPLTQLLPNWKKDGAPVETKVTNDQFFLLTQNHAITLPTPPQMRNDGNYIISLGALCKWLAEQAESMGISIFPGFAATELLYDDQETVIGVKTGDMGIDRDGNPTDRHQAGINIIANQVVIAEGCHGSLTKQLINKYRLRDDKSPQTYGLGIKELWEIPEQFEKAGNVIHTIGWPLDSKTYGGSFLYYMNAKKLAVGFVIGLDYKNPYLDPFQELQKFKTHPSIKKYFKNAKRICYGARALAEGGWQSLPKLTFPGGMLIGDTAGFLNVPKIKGIHNAIQSGIIAAENIVSNLSKKEITEYNTAIKKSNIGKELNAVRNIRPGFKWGLWPGLINAALETYIFKGKSPWTLKHNFDYKTLAPSNKSKKPDYPKPDGILTFDKLSSVYLANIGHEENQPNHLILEKPELAIDVNYKNYSSPESYYCPASVYEIVEINGEKQLQINSANCVHCKSCDIKDPMQNINWVAPEGGSGPNYNEM